MAEIRYYVVAVGVYILVCVSLAALTGRLSAPNIFDARTTCLAKVAVILRHENKANTVIIVPATISKLSSWKNCGFGKLRNLVIVNTTAVSVIKAKLRVVDLLIRILVRI